MSSDVQLDVEQASSARLIQQQIDLVAQAGGGRVVLPAMELNLDRGLALRSHVELVGQGEQTLLRKGPGRIYPLAGYHNYGMCDVPLADVTGLEVGMTVSVHDGSAHGGFYETFATITWIKDNWVGLDHGIEADYRADDKPSLTTVYPLVFGHRIQSAAVRDLRLEGNRAASDRNMGGCRGGAIYFYQSRGLEITGIRESDYDGEGLSFQMCRDVIIRDAHFDGNSGNGLHPGAGSTNAFFENCGGQGNAKSGFFFCVRANHITIRDCEFAENGSGISIGTRDCNNLIENCRVRSNRGVGVLVRPSPRPVEVHSCRIRQCTIQGNSDVQIDVTTDAHDLIFEANQIDGGDQGIGIRIAETASSIHLESNDVTGCEQDTQIQDSASLASPTPFTCGYGDAPADAFQHLAVPERD